MLDSIQAQSAHMQASNPADVPDCLKVSSKSSPASVAGAIAGMIKDGRHVELQSVGAGAVNQAIKAIAIARGFLSPVGIEIACAPSFADIVIDGEYRTAIRFDVFARTELPSSSYLEVPLTNSSSAPFEM